jgi:hypothetical protein
VAFFAPEAQLGLQATRTTAWRLTAGLRFDPGGRGGGQTQPPHTALVLALGLGLVCWVCSVCLITRNARCSGLLLLQCNILYRGYGPLGRCERRELRAAKPHAEHHRRYLASRGRDPPPPKRRRMPNARTFALKAPVRAVSRRPPAHRPPRAYSVCQHFPAPAHSTRGDQNRRRRS